MFITTNLSINLSMDISVVFLIGFPGSTMVKNLLPLQEMQGMCVLSINWDDPLEEEMTIYSIILAWEIPWTEKPDGYGPWGNRVGHD